MNLKKTSLALAVFSVLAIAFTIGCAKNSNPKPPIHDTVTVKKTDTLTDTLYVTKPDSSVNLTKGLLVYLPFAGNIADSSGNGNPTQSSGGTVLTTDRNGYSNNAFGTTGNGEEVFVTNNGSIKFDTAYTLSFSFLLNSYGSQTFVSFVNPATGNGPSFNVGMGTTILGGQYLDLGLSNVTSGCDNSGASDPNKLLDTTTVIPALNTWYNAIYAYYKGTIKVYVNGALVSTKQSAGPTAQLCPSSQLIVGAWWNSDKQGIKGKLDNIRLYNRTLTAKEITTLSQSYLVVGTSVKPSVRTN
jgi:hypothetical protein